MYIKKKKKKLKIKIKEERDMYKIIVNTKFLEQVLGYNNGRVFNVYIYSIIKYYMNLWSFC